MVPARGEGAHHLAMLARAPRPAGGVAERAAREYAADVLRRAGFAVTMEPFEYSSLPGRFATPIGGATAALTVLAAARFGLGRGAPWGALFALGAGTAILALFARGMLGDAVIDLPWLRRTSTNLVATRTATPRVWLVAHLDSKSQPVPSLGRVAGISLLVAGLMLATLAAVLQLRGVHARTLWWAAVAVSVLGAPIVMASVVDNRSDGAVDNASGVAAVLAAAQSVPAGVEVGVLLPSAEELGLAGARAWARAWARGRAAAIALNCDGIDDQGELTIMYSGTAPRALLRTLCDVADSPPRARRMPLGLLTDSVAFTDRGWAAVTVSRGSLATLRRVHTAADSLARLRGEGIDEVAILLARAAEALAR